jgi:uncharacterized Zn finger protein
MGKSPMSLALVDCLCSVGVQCKHAVAIYHSLDRLQLTDMHPDDLAALLWLALRKAEQRGWERGSENAQMIIQCAPFPSDGHN